MYAARVVIYLPIYNIIFIFHAMGSSECNPAMYRGNMLTPTLALYTYSNGGTQTSAQRGMRVQC